MKKKKECSSKDHEIFKKMDHVKEKRGNQARKIVLKSKTEVCVHPICGDLFNQLIFFTDHNKKEDE